MSDFIDAFRNKFGFGRMTASANADADQMLKSAEWAWHASRECIFSESLKKDASRYRWIKSAHENNESSIAVESDGELLEDIAGLSPEHLNLDLAVDTMIERDSK